MNRRGGILPVALFLTLAFVSTAVYFTDLAAVMIRRQRAETACDFGLLSALRVRAAGLEAIAQRWSTFGGDLVYSGGAVTVDSTRWSSIWADADVLRRAVSGYQGRVTAALTVALDANGFPASGVRSTAGTGLRLGISAQALPVVVGGIPSVLDGGWFARSWAPSEAAPLLSDEARLSLEWPTGWRGGVGTLSVRSSGALRWDVDPTDPDVAARGRGGFARNLAESLDTGDFSPHRFPAFRSTLRPAAP